MRTLTTPIPVPDSDVYVSTERVTPETNTVSFNNVTNLSVGDFLLVEEFGCEMGEVVKVSSISGDEVIFNDNFLFEHPSGIVFNKVLYDSFIVERENVEIFEGSIDYTNSYNLITYTDSSDDYSLTSTYKIYGFNSETSNKVLLEELGPNEKIGWITPSEVRSELGLSADDVSEDLIVESIILAVKRINEVIVSYKVYDGVSKDYSYIFNDGWNFHDVNGDGVVDTKDLYVYELDAERDVAFFKNYLINKISNTNTSRKISFKKKLPGNNKQLKFFIPSTFNHISSNLSLLRRVSKLMVSNILLSKSNNENLVFGVSSWNAGGTNVTRDSRGVADVIKANEEEIKSLLQNDLTKLKTWTTKLRRIGNVRDDKHTFNPVTTNFYDRW